MTKQQVEGFKQYVQLNEPDFYRIMDTVCLFAINRDGEDSYYLMENAFTPIRPNPANIEKYSSLLAQYKKENKIYKPVPDITDDFWNYLLNHHMRLANRLNGNFDVVFKNGRHEPSIGPDAGELAQSDKDEFALAWIGFSNTLINI